MSTTGNERTDERHFYEELLKPADTMRHVFAGSKDLRKEPCERLRTVWTREDTVKDREQVQAKWAF